MKPGEFATLDRGDRIRQEGCGNSFAVEINYGKTVSAVRLVHVSNAIEWEVGGKAVDRIQSLQRGQLITHRGNGNECIVTSTHGHVVLAAQTLLLSEQESANWMVAAKIGGSKETI